MNDSNAISKDRIKAEKDCSQWGKATPNKTEWIWISRIITTLEYTK